MVRTQLLPFSQLLLSISTYYRPPHNSSFDGFINILFICELGRIRTYNVEIPRNTFIHTSSLLRLPFRHQLILWSWWDLNPHRFRTSALKLFIFNVEFSITPLQFFASTNSATRPFLVCKAPLSIQEITKISPTLLSTKQTLFYYAIVEVTEK